MQKRLISMVLALSMALTAMPLPALAQSAPPDTASAAALAEENGDVTDIYTDDNSSKPYGDLFGNSNGSWSYDETSNTLTLVDGTFRLYHYSYSSSNNYSKLNLKIEPNATLQEARIGSEYHNGYTVTNAGTISGGTFQGEVYNHKTISDGTFKEAVEVYASSGENATIEGGTFERTIMLMNGDASITIKDGLFDDEVVTEECNSPLFITGGLFTKAVNASSIDDPTNLQITGGYFVSKPTVPEGSDIAFTTVSDQNGRTFQVPVNDGFSENGYKTLYVPHGMSERQANPITVKTDTALTDCLADGVSIMETDKVQKNDDGSYTIEVYQPESIVLVTEKPAPPTPDEPGDELDPGFSSGAAALGIVLGTAGLGYITYAHISSLYLYYTLPGGFIPSTRQELANVLWTTAGKPDPVSTALYTDIPADNIEQQKAARWCVEQGLLSDHGATFGPDTKVTNARIIRAWNSLKKVPVPITN
mgnify:CR=1 FL=1